MIIQSDVCRPMHVSSIDCAKYFVTFTEDTVRYISYRKRQVCEKTQQMTQAIRKLIKKCVIHAGKEAGCRTEESIMMILFNLPGY